MSTPERFPHVDGPPFRPLGKWQAPPEPGLYLDRDDRIYARMHSFIGTVVVFRARWQDPDGRVGIQVFRFIVAATRSEQFFTFDLGEGTLLGFTLIADTGSQIRRGMNFAEIGIVRGGVDRLDAVHTLVADYYGRTMALGWPGGNITQTIEGNGAVVTFITADPAAGAQIVATVQSFQAWTIQTMRFTLVTSAVVATRRVHVVFDDGASVFYDVAANDTQAASLTRNYNVAPFGYQPTAQDNEIYISIPPTELTSAGWRMRTTLTNGDAGDDFSAAVLSTEQWAED